MLTNTTITFGGKYTGKDVTELVQDRGYARWVLMQEWVQLQYPRIYNYIWNYDPLTHLVSDECVALQKAHWDTKRLAGDIVQPLRSIDDRFEIDPHWYDPNGDFIDTYVLFNLPQEDLATASLNLSGKQKICYTYYLSLMATLRERIETNQADNEYDIKAPNSYLQTLTNRHGIGSVEFNEFLESRNLPKLRGVVEAIKRYGGIDYKGNKSFLIAKARSVEQEKYWEVILKKRYGDEISSQFQYGNCIFDFINISTRTIFECKLGLKDFNEAQHIKYNVTLGEYRIVYLIGTDCVIDMERNMVITTNTTKYSAYISAIANKKTPTYLDVKLESWENPITPEHDLSSLFGNLEVRTARAAEIQETGVPTTVLSVLPMAPAPVVPLRDIVPTKTQSETLTVHSAQEYERIIADLRSQLESSRSEK